MMNLKFKPATKADLPEISLLAEKIWREHYPSIIGEKQVDYMLATRYSHQALMGSMDRGEQFYLAYNEEEAVAYSAIELTQDCCYLHKFYVDVSSHRKGLGKLFFDYLLTQVSTNISWRLQVNRQNIKAINFYFKMGFVIETVGDFAIGEGYYMNDFVMVRK